MERGRVSTLLLLHLLLAFYSLCSVCGKLASGFDFPSLGFVLCYGGMIFVLGIYAIGWQQVIKRLPLTSAYANKAVTILWGAVWGTLLFKEQISLQQAIGMAVVLAGVVLYSVAESHEEG